MGSIAEALRGLAAVDADLARTPRSLGAAVASESEPHAGTVHGARHRVLLEPLLLALPLTRTLVLAAGSTRFVELTLPAATPEALHALLAAQSPLTADEATRVVDLTVDALERHLGVRPDPHAGLSEDAYALAHLDLAFADAADDARHGLAEAIDLTVGAFDALAGGADLARRLGSLGLTEVAGLVAAHGA